MRSRPRRYFARMVMAIVVAVAAITLATSATLPQTQGTGVMITTASEQEPDIYPDPEPRHVAAQLEMRVTQMRPSRSGRREVPAPDWLRTCSTDASDRARAHGNGQVPARELCRLPQSGHILHPDAAAAWWRLSRSFAQRFGASPCISDSFRSYEAQAEVYAAKPELAAQPGTSNHGWAVALDLCGGAESYTSTKHRWLVRRGADFGWRNPSWARSNGSRPEPWHWEYTRR